jgi:hypothetical protein
MNPLEASAFQARMDAAQYRIAQGIRRRKRGAQ